MKATRNFLDLMTPEGKAKALEKAKKRLQKRSGSSTSIEPEMYIVAELGYYYGWEAIMAIRRGYVEVRDNDGKIAKQVFTLEEAITLVEAAKKVWYSKLIEQGHANFVANIAPKTKNPSESFIKGVEPFADRAKVG